MFEKLLKVALRCGVGVADFWDLTYGEITGVIYSYNQNYEDSMKEKAYMNYTLAYLVGGAMGGELPSIADVYPTLFKEEEEQSQDNEWLIQKERMLDYANWHNNKAKGGEGD